MPLLHRLDLKKAQHIIVLDKCGLEKQLVDKDLELLPVLLSRRRLLMWVEGNQKEGGREGGREGGIDGGILQEFIEKEGRKEGRKGRPGSTRHVTLLIPAFFPGKSGTRRPDA